MTIVSIVNVSVKELYNERKSFSATEANIAAYADLRMGMWQNAHRWFPLTLSP